MKCQNCGHREAELTIQVQYRGQQQWELHLCPQCAAMIQRFTQSAMAEYQKQRVAVGAGSGGEQGRFFLGVPHPAGLEPEDIDGVEALQMRRRRNELQALLEEAVGAEAYEEAAKLRDAMKQLEKGVYLHEQ